MWTQSKTQDTALIKYIDDECTDHYSYEFIFLMWLKIDLIHTYHWEECELKLKAAEKQGQEIAIKGSIVNRHKNKLWI